MDKNIKEFKIKAEYYVARAMESEIDGDYVEAIYCIKRAINYAADDLYLKLKLATYYETLELFSEANDIHFALLKEYGSIMHCYYSICDNMYALGNVEAAEYYMRQYNNVSQTEGEREEISLVILKHLSDRKRDEFAIVPAHVSKCASGRLSEGMALINKSKYKEAIDVFDSIPIDYMDGLLAMQFKSKCYQSLSNYDEAERIALEALAVEPNDIYIIDLLISLYHNKQQPEKQGKYYNIIIETEYEKREDVIAAIETLCINEQFDLMEIKCEQALNDFPSDVEIMSRLGSSCYNQGKYQKAADIFTKVMRVRDYIGAVKYYKNCAEKAVAKNITTPPKTFIFHAEEFPPREEVAKVKYVLKAAQLRQSGLIDDYALYSDEKFVDALRYYLIKSELPLYYNSQSCEVDSVLETLCETGGVELVALFDELLTKSYVGDTVKRLIIYHYCYMARRSDVKFTYSGIFCAVQIDEELKLYPQVFRKTYAYCLSVLGIITRKFEKELKKAMAVLIDSANRLGKSFRRHEALAACVVSTMTLKIDLSDFDILCSVFSADKNLVKRYIKELGL